MEEIACVEGIVALAKKPHSLREEGKSRVNDLTPDVDTPMIVGAVVVADAFHSIAA
jgi:hypothetical protein